MQSLALAIIMVENIYFVNTDIYYNQTRIAGYMSESHPLLIGQQKKMLLFHEKSQTVFKGGHLCSPPS